MDISTAEKLLKDTSADELIRIIAKLSSYNTDADEWLLDYCKKHSESEKELIIQRQIQHYWNTAESIIDEANDYGGTSYSKEEDACYALDQLEELVNENPFSWTFRRPIADAMLEQFYRGNSGFEDRLADLLYALCRSGEERLYLADSFSSSTNKYYQNAAADLYLRYGETDKFIELQSANLEYGSDYIKLADYYKKNGNRDKAVAIVEDALKKANGRMDEIYEWLFHAYKQKHQENKINRLYQLALTKKRDLDTITEMMYDYYSGDYERKKEFLLKMPEVCRREKAREWFDKCAKELNDTDFRANSDHLYQLLKEKNIQTYLQLRIDEGELAEVVECLTNNRRNMYGYDYVDANHNLTRQLSDAYPREICMIYWDECEALCSQSNKKNYMSAVSILKEIRKIAKKNDMENEWSGEFARFLEKHKRKSLLMGYIKDGKI